MDTLFHLLHLNITVSSLIIATGYAGVTAVVFAESGLLFGFIFPGDSLLFTAGLLASAGYLNPWILVPLLVVAAIAGDSTGYWIGKSLGHRIFRKDDSLFFHKKYVDQTQEYFKKHGNQTIILARFVPIVRTFAPVMAGVGRMPYGKFLRNNVIGATLWAAGVTLIAYFLGNAFPQIDHYLLPIISAIVIVSFLPVVYHVWKERSAR